MNEDKIIERNKARLVLLANPYNPYTGEGSLIARHPLKIDNKCVISLPIYAYSNGLIQEICEFGSVIKWSAATKTDMPTATKKLLLIRIAYDFEFWAATCVKIQDKLTKKMLPFILSRPQRKLLKILQEELFSNKPVRIILLKARQWGGSTLVQIFMAWIQLFHHTGWHSVVMADVEDQSRNIKAMYSRLATHHPSEVCKIEFKTFEGSTKNKIIKNRNCIVYLGSMQKPDAIRSADVMMAHLSEVGLWKETEGKKPEDVVQSIAGTVPLSPYSLIVMESTAKGIGNFFHREWCKAVDGQSGYTPVFVAWYEIDMYSIPFASEGERLQFVKSMTDQERHYFDLGATLEAINWYRTKKHKDSFSDWRMGCEYPTTPQEAFQSTGNRAHSPSYIHQMRDYCRVPKYKGDMFADARSGKEALGKSLLFQETPEGTLWLWSKPDKATKMRDRYIVSMDIGGRSATADWSVISVIDRYFLTEGGVEECIGTCRFHLDQDLAVWKAVQIARYFNNALLVIEANSLNPKGSEGDHTLTILDEIKGLYDNIYCRTDPQKIREGAPIKYGFFTSAASKTDLVNQMNARYREVGHIERDSRALDEADNYEIKSNGSYGAVDGTHDDIYMSRAIGLKASQVTQPPSLIPDRQKPTQKKSKAIRSESSI